MSAPLHLLATGMVTAVGLDAAASCAAMRARLDGFCETRFMDPAGAWQVGAPVPLPRNWIGQKRMVHLAAGAVADVFRQRPGAGDELALILCLAEDGRPGRPVSDVTAFGRQLAEQIALPARLKTHVIAHGRPSGHAALARARKIMADGLARHVLILGVDSYLTVGALAHFHDRKRLLTPANADGFIPGEAAAAILLGPEPGALRLTGLGLAREEAFAYNALDDGGQNLPLRGDGMTAAYRAAMEEANLDLAHVEYRISDVGGEQYFFKQTALASLRLERGRKEFQDLWTPAESLGNIGAAAGPLMLGMALQAVRKGYACGSPVLIEASGDDGACGAAVLHEVRP